LFFIGHRKKKVLPKEQIFYSGITALYFGEPIYEKIRATLNCPERKLELFFHSETYILDLDRLTANYYPDLFTSFLARGNRCFGKYWPEEQVVLENEQKRRFSSAEGKIWPKEGIAIQYHAKDSRTILILLDLMCFWK